MLNEYIFSDWVLCSLIATACNESFVCAVNVECGVNCVVFNTGIFKWDCACTHV